MGNHSSKKRCSNSHEIFSTYKLISEDKKVYDENEHSSHILYREAFKGNFSSPIKDILLNPNTKILDVGCGSGFWLMEMAADYSKPKYFGIDMLPLFPTFTFPSNIEFLQCDILKGLPYENNTFDFIHVQFLICDFTESQWKKIVYKELVRVLKPGGWLEICDPEFELVNGGPASKRLGLTVRNSLMSKNINPLVDQLHHSLIKSIPSFSSETVHCEKRDVQLSSCAAGKIGKFGGLHIKESCRLMLQGQIGKDMNIKKKDIDLTLDKIASELELNQAYFRVYRFYVQKK